MQALRLCDTLPALLAAAPRLQVHSVFTQACNLQAPGGELVTLQARAMPLVPRGCILPCEDLRPLFAPGLHLAVRGGMGLELPGLSIGLANAARCSLRVADLPLGQDRVALQSALRGFLPEAAPEQGMHQLLRGPGHGLPAGSAAALATAIAALEGWLRGQHAAMPLEQALQHLVGFGVGLTPAADDFLLGVLLAMDALRDARRDELGTALRSSSSRTTAVSAAMFDNACAGRYGAHLLALWTAPVAALPATLAAIARHGHSSGHDSLCGVAFALDCLAGP